ncbi:MAG: hypothetical protein KC731_18970 [Myxococcales bacterium]|nr:hypothetical protein [Myxococcales bacterium]
MKRLLTAAVLGLLFTLGSTARAQRAFDCNSDTAKQQLSRTYAVYHKKSDPFPGVMPWWPVNLGGMPMLFSKKNNPQKDFVVEGKNYAFYLDRSRAQTVNLLASPLDQHGGKLGVTLCTYRATRGNRDPANPENLVLVDSTGGTVLDRHKDDPLYLRTLRSRTSSDTLHTVMILSPSYYSGKHRYRMTFPIAMKR